jgi:FkbM family methyltransferase
MKLTGIERGPLGENDLFMDLIFEGRTRRVMAPHTEMLALNEVFTKPEYPLPDKLVELCRGLPVLDIGAHVGSAAVYFEELLAPSKIVCYEPNPVACEYIKWNAPQAELHQQGVSNAAGTGEMFIRVPMFASGMFHGSGDPPEPDLIEVPIVTGIEAIQNIEGEIGVLKVDVESADWNVLYPMRSQFGRVRVIFVEYHNEDLRRAIDSLLRDFQLFHSGTISPELAPWGQGTLGYVHKRWLEKIKCD